MKRVVWAFALAGSLLGVAAPAKAGQIVQAQSFNSEFVLPVGVLHDHPAFTLFFESFPEASAGLGRPVVLTSAGMQMQIGLSIFFEAVNTSTIAHFLDAFMEVDDWGGTAGGIQFEEGEVRVSAVDTCGPGESCVGFALSFPFTRAVSAPDLSLFITDEFPVFAQFVLHFDPGPGNFDALEAFEGTARGGIFGTVSLTYEYTVPEPHPIALLALALASLGMARRRKLR